MTADHDDTPLAAPLTPLSEASGLCGGPGQLSCSEVNEFVQEFLDQTVDPELHQQVQQHLGNCPPCESEFVVYQRIISALERCRPDLPIDAAARIQKFCSDLCDGSADDAS